MFKAMRIHSTFISNGKDEPSYKFFVEGYNEGKEPKELTLSEEHDKFSVFQEAFFDALDRMNQHLEISKIKELDKPQE